MRDLGIPRASEIVQEALERADIASFLTPDLQTLELLKKLRRKYEAIDLITGSNLSNAISKMDSLLLSS